MNTPHKSLYWVPRVLGILSILFISMFALDVFGGELTANVWLGLAVHLIPSLILVVALIIAWKNEKGGGWIFVLFSIVPFVFLSNVWWVNAMLAAPFFLTGVLFLWHARAASKTVLPQQGNQ